MPRNVHGAAVIKRRLRLIARNVRDEVRTALDEAAEDLLFRARLLAPQLEGELIDSGKIARHRSRGVEARTISFGTPYAVVRHEDFYNLGPISSVKSSADGPVGRKYLSRPFERHSPRYFEEIGDAVERGIRQSLR